MPAFVGIVDISSMLLLTQSHQRALASSPRAVCPLQMLLPLLESCPTASRRLLEKIRCPRKAPSGSIEQQRNGSKLEKMNESEKALPCQICPCLV